MNKVFQIRMKLLTRAYGKEGVQIYVQIHSTKSEVRAWQFCRPKESTSDTTIEKERPILPPCMFVENFAAISSSYVSHFQIRFFFKHVFAHRFEQLL